MTNGELNNALLAFGQQHFGNHENVSLYFWYDCDDTRKLRWLISSKDGLSQGCGETLAAARADLIARRSEKIAALEAQLSKLKTQ